jgi:putative flippase GtrA
MGSVKQFLIYACVGLINTAVHFAVFILLLRVFGVPVLVASTIGYSAGVANSYFMNRLWTFAVTTRVNGMEFGRFVLVNLVSLALNLGVLQYLTTVVGLGPEVSQVLAIGVSLAANFAGNKWWAFRSHA